MRRQQVRGRGRLAGAALRWQRRLTLDVVALALFASVLSCLLTYAALQPPSRFTFSIAHQPRQIHLPLTTWYAPEQNAAGWYRWAKPETWMSIPVDAPAAYRLTLTMQDAPTNPTPRSVTVLVNGTVAGQVTLSNTLRDYTVEHRVDGREWASGAFHELRVDLKTALYFPPGDERVLGALVTRVAVEPAQALPPLQPSLLFPNLLLLVVAYGALRFMGMRVPEAAVAVGAALGAFALLVVGARATALYLAYEAIAHPLGFLATLGALAAVPALSRWVARLAGAREAPGRHEARGWLAGLREAVWLFTILRVVSWGFAIVASVLLGLRSPCERGQQPSALYPDGLAFPLLGAWQRFDACRYQQIAELGYQHDQASVAFFPLYPLLMRAVGTLLAGNLPLAGLIVSGIAYIAAMAGLYQLVCLDFDVETARRSLLYISVFPMAFFYFAPFTEALFLALAIWALLLARRGAWGWAALPAFLVGLARPQGCLLALPLAWECARQWRRWPLPRRLCAPSAHAPPGCDPRPVPVAAAGVPLLPICGLLTFAAYSSRSVALTPWQAQESWASVLHAPWVVIALSWENRSDAILMVNATLIVLFAALSIAGLRQLPVLYSLYTVPPLMLAAMRTSSTALISTGRFVVVLFPVFVLIALLGRHDRVHQAWLIVSLLFLGLFLFAFLSGKFIA